MSQSPASTSSSGAAGQEVGEPYLFLTLDGNQPLAPISRHCMGDIDEVHVGRGAERSVQRQVKDGKTCLLLRFPDPWMSGLHARVMRTSKGMAMADPGSKNGSFVNGTRLDSAVLTDGDILQFGHTFFIYRAELPSLLGEEPDKFADMDTPMGLATMLSPLSDSFISFGRAAVTDEPMLLHGETGTGKSMMARWAHALSGREGSFVALTLGEISDTGVEKKLRGGTLTANETEDSASVFDQARGGTLLLENIDNMSLRSQVLLASILRDGVVAPLDGGPNIPIQCRIICTVSDDLDTMVASGRFDPALAGFISHHHLYLPPLRQRREDLGLLIASMLKLYGSTDGVSFSADAAHALLCYSWPRNLRELESSIGTALAWRTSGMIEISHLPPELQRPTDVNKQAGGDTIDTVELVQQDLEKRANIIASLRARSGYMFNNRDTVEQVRNQFQRWLERADDKPPKKRP